MIFEILLYLIEANIIGYFEKKDHRVFRCIRTFIRKLTYLFTVIKNVRFWKEEDKGDELYPTYLTAKGLAAVQRT